jgi:hypothetical protein
MKPWFIKEAEIIKFPEPVKNVVELPNVQSYPDFLTGVKDLQNRLGKGEISQDSHDKLYQDLIHRFMRKESFENPWFLRELAPDQMKANIQSTIANLNVKDEASLAILKQLYTVLNRTGLQGRVRTVFGKDDDVAKYQAIMDVVSDQFLKSAEKDPVEAKQFLDQYEKNPNAVNVKGLLSNPGKVVPIEALFTTPFAKRFGKRLSAIQGSGFKQGNVGPGEIALAVLSNQIKLTAGEETGGDIEIAGKGYEVKGGGTTGKGGRLFDKGQVDFKNTKAYLGKDMANAGNLSVDLMSKIDPELQDFDRTDTDDMKTPGAKSGKQGITSDPEIWVNKDMRWWLGFTRANLTDWARLYGVKGFLGMSIKEAAKVLVGAMGTPQFKNLWVRAHFLGYQQKAGHSGILLVGPEKVVLLTDGQQLVDLNLVVGHGQVFGANINQARDVTIQLGL